jgi:hypothetical protein
VSSGAETGLSRMTLESSMATSMGEYVGGIVKGFSGSIGFAVGRILDEMNGCG